MRIDHAALFCRNLEQMRQFFIDYFDARSNEQYHNPRTGLRTYILSFTEGSTRLELMQRTEQREPSSSLEWPSRDGRRQSQRPDDRMPIRRSQLSATFTCHLPSAAGKALTCLPAALPPTAIPLPVVHVPLATVITKAASLAPKGFRLN